MKHYRFLNIVLCFVSTFVSESVMEEESMITGNLLEEAGEGVEKEPHAPWPRTSTDEDKMTTGDILFQIDRRITEIVDIINDQNEVIIYQERDPNTRSLKQYLVENEMISDCGKECRDSLNIVKRTSKALMIKGQDPYPLKVFEFSIPLNPESKIHRVSVKLDNGFLFGMSDFRPIGDSISSQDLWFEWNHLRGTFRISIDNEGFRENGEVDVRMEPLLMHVKFQPRETKLSNIEMTKVGDIKIKVLGLDTIDADSVQDIRTSIESRVRRIVDYDVRNILQSQVKHTLQKTSTSKIISSALYENTRY